MTTPKFAYKPLDRSKHEFRIMTFEPGSSHDGGIHCTLRTYNIANCPEYVALSYAWGEPEPCHEITLDGCAFRVRDNLWTALLSLRQLSKDGFPRQENRTSLGEDMFWMTKPRRATATHFWIDAICIDQNDPLECGHQVSMMKTIFSKAAFVIPWLGPASDDSDSAGFTSNDWRSSWDANGSLLRRQYWERRWVVQEFVLARDLFILCGSHGAWWCDLAGGLWSGLSGVFQYEYGQLPSQRLIDYRYWTTSLYDGAPSQTLDELLTTFSSTKCADPRDKVYSLLPLVKDNWVPAPKPLLADYTISANTLYYRV
ncbi:hypothetical protein DL769_009538 [Monosporascus sp. CRB-8-3]|nr:hypothetical protein DL769_009538 [Monosporascus sp. CRB-8-3]